MKGKFVFQKKLKRALIRLRLFNLVSKAQNRTFKFLKSGYSPKNFWNQWSDSYFHQPARTKFDTAHTWLKARLKASAPGRILEVGCGFGRNLKFIGEETGAGCRVFGMDISEEMLKKAAAFAGPELRVMLSVGDIGAMPFKDDSFDMVFTYGTLMHVPPHKCRGAFTELLRVSRRGVIIIEEILLGNGGRSAGRAINDYTFIHQYEELLKDMPIIMVDKQRHQGLVDLFCLHCEKKR